MAPRTISNAPSTPPAESSIASSATATPGNDRLDADTLSGCGHVDNAEEALPTCPQPQQQQTGLSRYQKKAAPRQAPSPSAPQPPTDSPEEATRISWPQNSSRSASSDRTPQRATAGFM